MKTPAEFDTNYVTQYGTDELQRALDHADMMIDILKTSKRPQVETRQQVRHWNFNIKTIEHELKNRRNQ